MAPWLPPARGATGEGALSGSGAPACWWQVEGSTRAGGSGAVGMQTAARLSAAPIYSWTPAAPLCAAVNGDPSATLAAARRPERAAPFSSHGAANSARPSLHRGGESLVSSATRWWWPEELKHHTESSAAAALADPIDLWERRVSQHAAPDRPYCASSLRVYSCKLCANFLAAPAGVHKTTRKVSWVDPDNEGPPEPSASRLLHPSMLPRAGVAARTSARLETERRWQAGMTAADTPLQLLHWSTATMQHDDT